MALEIYFTVWEKEVKTFHFYILLRYHRSYVLGIIADDSTDAAGNEQFVLCLRLMNPITSEVRETFIGMHLRNDRKADSLFHTTEGFLIRLNKLELQQVREHCFDGAPNIWGQFSGVHKLIKGIHRDSLFVHCSNHSLEFCLLKRVRTGSLLCEVLRLLKDIITVIFIPGVST